MRLQSLSTVILEPKKLKSVTVSTPPLLLFAMKWWYWMLTYYWFHIPKWNKRSLIWSFGVSRPGKFCCRRIVCESLWRLIYGGGQFFSLKILEQLIAIIMVRKYPKAWNKIAKTCTMKKSLGTLFRITVLWHFGHILEPLTVGVVCKWRHKWVQIKFLNSNMLLLKLKKT